MLPTTEQEEEWCLRVWLDWRRSQGLGELESLPSPPSGPDRCYRDSQGRVLGVEITRVLDPAEREQESFAEKFLQREVIPRVEGRVPGEVFAMIVLPCSVPHRLRGRTAEMLADKIIGVSKSLELGKTASCAIAVDDASVNLSLVRGEGRERVLRLGATSFAAIWDGDDRYIEAVARAVRAKAARGQLDLSGFDRRVLLLHDRMPGITPQALRQAIGQLESERVLLAFDEIFLVDTYAPGRCLKA